MAAPVTKELSFPGAQGASLAAKLDLPEGEPCAYAIFAHCFTCSKEFLAASRISEALADLGVGVLRFDFTGLGASEGEFEGTNFTSNVGDLIAAANHLRENFEAPKILVGHSLGGAAVLAAAPDVPETVAVATIGAPADPHHVSHLFEPSLGEIKEDGAANVSIGGRDFTIQQQFVDDIANQDLTTAIGTSRKALLLFHSPMDQTVSIENAAKIYGAAKHPKSFVSLDKADHLLTKKKDAIYVAKVLNAWASRYVY
jgi:putative redox protein